MGFFAYRHECGDCREARKQLKRDGVSLRAIKAYLLTIGHVDEFRIIDSSLTMKVAEPKRSSNIVVLR